MSQEKDKDWKEGFRDEVECLTQVINIKPNNIEAYLERANLLFWFLGDGEKAISDCNTVLHIDPNCVAAYCMRASIYLYYLQNKSEAFHDVNKAIDLDNDSYDAYSIRAEIYEEQKQYMDAAADFSKLIELSTYHNLKLGMEKSDLIELYEERA